jgi:hypothetical protein
MTYEPSRRLRWLPRRENRLKTLVTWVAIALISFTIPKIVTRPKTTASLIPWHKQLAAAWA